MGLGRDSSVMWAEVQLAAAQFTTIYTLGVD